MLLRCYIQYASKFGKLNSGQIMEKVREFQKKIYFCFTDYTKAFDYVDHSKLWQVLKEMGVPGHLIYCISWEIYMWDRKQQLELDMEQLIGSKLGKEYNKDVYCLSAYLTYMKNTICERQDWMNPKTELRLPEEISTTSDKQMIPLWWQKVRRN